MKDADRLRRLFTYDDWSNRQILSGLDKTDLSVLEHRNNIISLMSHLLAAQELWHHRIQGMDVEDVEIWPDYNWEKLQEQCSRLTRLWLKLLDENENDLDRMISYNNSSGTAYQTMLSDILHHVIIHGQHHRAQIALWLRESGITPPPTDFIYYTRQNEM